MKEYTKRLQEQIMSETMRATDGAIIATLTNIKNKIETIGAEETIKGIGKILEELSND